MVMQGKLREQTDFGTIEAPSYLKKLDLGCGNNKKLGFLGVDRSQDVSPDILHDLDVYPWPFEDESAFEIFSSHFIEHVKDINSFMDECWRILVPRGMMVIIAPYYSSIRSFQDYTHVRPISEATFNYFNQEWMKANKLEHYGVKCNFERVYINFYFDPEWNTKSEAARNWAQVHYINVISDMEIGLRAIK
jgi:predicted SAM-dependent methyltransferase